MDALLNTNKLQGRCGPLLRRRSSTSSWILAWGKSVPKKGPFRLPPPFWRNTFFKYSGSSLGTRTEKRVVGTRKHLLAASRLQRNKATVATGRSHFPFSELNSMWSLTKDLRTVNIAQVDIWLRPLLSSPPLHFFSTLRLCLYVLPTLSGFSMIRQNEHREER